MLSKEEFDMLDKDAKAEYLATETDKELTELVRRTLRIVADASYSTPHDVVKTYLAAEVFKYLLVVDDKISSALK